MKKDENEWEEPEKVVEVAKTAFKIEGKAVEDLQKKVEEDTAQDESAKWDEEDPDFMKARAVPKVEEKPEEASAFKSTGSSIPMFGGNAPPKFKGTSGSSLHGSSMSKKVVDSEAFPELG